jgi:nitrite reductase/ring-hydroxylating ferredoxin subunit
VNRREFLATSSALAITAVLAACGSDSDEGSPMTGPRNVNATVTLASYAALGTVGGIAVISGAGTPIAVVRASATQYRAFSLICPNAGTTVAISGTGFRCPNHGATFNGSGAWTGGERTNGLFEFTVASNTAAGTITITS